MKLVIITNLYPSYPNQPLSDVTYALHYFMKEWAKEHEVRVFVPWIHYPKVFNFSKKGRLKNKGAFEENFYMDNVKIVRIPIKRIPGLKINARELLKAGDIILNHLKSEHFIPNLVLNHRIDPGAPIAGIVARELKKPLIIGLHGSDVINLLKGKYRQPLYDEALKSSKGISFRSVSLLKKVEEAFPDFVHSRDVYIAVSGLKKELYLDERSLRSKTGFFPSKVITVCRLVKNKNVNSIIKAIERLQGLTLTVVGDGNEKDKLKKLVAKLGIRDRVQFIGGQPREKVIELLRNHHIFAMISKNETLGLVYLEAMANGCLTIGSKGEGIDGIIKHKKNGFLCEPGNTGELREILEMIVKINREEREKIILNAYTTAKNLNLRKVSSDYLKWLEQLL